MHPATPRTGPSESEPNRPGWGWIITLATAVITCTGTVIAAGVPALLGLLDGSDSSQRAPAALPTAASGSTAPPTATAAPAGKAVWKRVGDVDISLGGTNLEYWATNLLSDAEVEKGAGAGFDLALKASGDQFVFDPMDGSALATGKESFAPDDCSAAMATSSTTGLVAVTGRRYCVRSDVRYRYLLTVLGTSSDGSGLHVEIMIAVSRS